MTLIKLKRVLGLSILFLHIGRKSVYHLLHVVRVRKYFQSSEPRVIEHVFVPQVLAFEYFFIYLLSIKLLSRKGGSLLLFCKWGLSSDSDPIKFLKRCGLLLENAKACIALLFSWWWTKNWHHSAYSSTSINTSLLSWDRRRGRAERWRWRLFPFFAITWIGLTILTYSMLMSILSGKLWPIFLILSL